MAYYRRRRVMRRRRFRPRMTRVKRYQKLVNGKAQKSWYQMSIPYIKKAVHGLMGIANAELKTVIDNDGGTIGAVSTGSWNVIALTKNIARGDQDNNRDGNSVKAKSIQIKGYVQPDPDSTLTHIRFLMITDKDGQGSDPTASELLQDQTNLFSFTNPDTTKRFVVMRDMTITLESGVRIERKINIFKNLYTHLKWPVAGSSAENNHIYILMATDDESSNLPTYNLQWKFRFYDN